MTKDDAVQLVLFQAHDERDECNVGDTVRVHMCRPLSKRKSWRVTEILGRAKIFDANVVQSASVPSPPNQHAGAPSFAAAGIMSS